MIQQTLSNFSSSLGGISGLVDSILSNLGINLNRSVVFIPGAAPNVTCVDCREAAMIIEAYSDLAPNNPLRAYLPYIEELERTGKRSSVSDLPGFNQAWLMAEQDERFLVAVMSLR